MLFHELRRGRGGEGPAAVGHIIEAVEMAEDQIGPPGQLFLGRQLNFAVGGAIAI